MSILLSSFRVGARSLTRRSLSSSRSLTRLFPQEKRVFARDSPRYHSKSDAPDEVLNSFAPDPERLLQALEMMAKSAEKLPPVPPGQDQESFWRAYLLANQIIMYLVARPQKEAEAFAAIFQSAAVPQNSPVARGRKGVLDITKQIVKIMAAIPTQSSLRASHPEVFQASEGLRKVHDAYLASDSGEGEADLEKWTKFFENFRPELVDFTTKIGPVVEAWEAEGRQ